MGEVPSSSIMMLPVGWVSKVDVSVGRRRTRLYVAMRVRALSARCNAFQRHRGVALLQQTLCFLLIVVVMLVVFSARAHFHGFRGCGLGVRARSFAPYFLRFLLTPAAAGAALDFVLVHGLERLAHAEEQHHEPALGELCVVDEVRVDHVLQVAAAVVWQEDVDGFRGRIGLVRLNGVVYRMDDVWVRREECVRLDFLERQAHALLPEGASYLFEGEELLVRIVLDKVDVREAALGVLLAM
jgi:hypothetical protein